MDPDLLQQVLDYHQATKHDFHGYARGPGYMDWATQPNHHEAVAPFSPVRDCV